MRYPSELRHIEHLEGTGQLLGVEPAPLDVEYSIDVSQEFILVPGIEPQPGMRVIGGSIVRGLTEDQIWAPPDQDLTLVLNDGRKLTIALRAGAGETADFDGRSDLQ